MAKFSAKGKPLTELQIARLSKIRVKDVNDAIATTEDKTLKPLLEASNRFSQ